MRGMVRYFMVTAIALLCCATFVACGSCNKEHIHEFDAREILAEATCVSEGVTVMRCKACDYTEIEKIEKTMHEYVIIRDVEATCFVAGETEEKCIICGSVKINKKPIIQHKFEECVVNANCENGGYTERKCLLCGFTEREETGEPTGHLFELVGKIRGDCGKPFVMVYKCSACEILKNENSDEIVPHVFMKEKIAPTCVSSGSVTEKCLYCIESSSEELPPAGHSLTVEKTQSTCCEKGKLICYCTNENCGYVDQTISLDYAAHIMKITVDGTERFIYSRDGVNLYSDPDCKNLISSALCNVIIDGKHFVCEKSQQCGMVVSGTPHEIISVDTSTCEENGVYSEICNKCGKVTVSYGVTAKGHNDTGVAHLCVKNEALTIKYRETGGASDLEICYVCPDCKKYIPVVPHVADIDENEVTCVNSQKCTECGEVLLTKDHTAPELTCVSSKNDGYYYCIVCQNFAMGKLTDHNFELVEEKAAGCKSDKVCNYKCECGKTDTQTITGTAIGHLVPAGRYVCVKDINVSDDYFAYYGILKDMAFICERCDEYVEVAPHELNCLVSEATCLQNQHCNICGKVFLEIPHEVPKYTCVSTKNDGFYYCKNCNEVPLGSLNVHNFIIEETRMAATCNENAKILYRCKCGLVNGDGFVETEGTKIGHKFPQYSITAKSNCGYGHLLHFYGFCCQNENCDLDFSLLVDENGDIYCLNLNKYIMSNGYSEDMICDERTGVASDKKVLSVLSCCEKTGYRYVPVAHSYGEQPVDEKDVEVNGKLYRYVASTCATQGSALFCCEKCYEYKYSENVMPLNPANHESPLLICGEHCEKCAPENSDCSFAFEIIVLRSDGREAVKNGLKLSAVYNLRFMSSNNRMIEKNDSGEVYFVLSDDFIAAIEMSIGPTYATAAAASIGNLKESFDWSDVRLYKNKFNSITVYIGGQNE